MFWFNVFICKLTSLWPLLDLAFSQLPLDIILIRKGGCWVTLFRIQSLPTTVKHYSSSLILFFISYLDYEMGCLHESYHQQVIFMHGLVLHPCSFPDISFELLNLCRECKFAGRVLESGHLSFFFFVHIRSDSATPRAKGGHLSPPRSIIHVSNETDRHFPAKWLQSGHPGILIFFLYMRYIIFL